MKFSASLILTPLALLATAVVATPTPRPEITVAEDGSLWYSGFVSASNDSGLEARALTGTVQVNGLRYRTCPRTSCTAIGQYQKGQTVSIQCAIEGEVINGTPFWGRLSNGYYVSLHYLRWTGGLNPC